MCRLGRELLVALNAIDPSPTVPQLWWRRLQSHGPKPISPSASVLVEAVHWLAGYGIYVRDLRHKRAARVLGALVESASAAKHETTGYYMRTARPYQAWTEPFRQADHL